MAVVSGASRDTHFALLDFYRFAGAMLVAGCHFGVVTLSYFYPLIDFFFVLSGFVIMHIYGRADGIRSIGHYGDYLRKRFARIYPLFALTLGMYVVVGLIAAQGLILSGGFPWFRGDTLLANVLLVHAWGTVSVESFNYPSWSVSAEFFVYLLFPALFLIVRRFGPVFALTLAVLYSAVLSAAFAKYSSIHWWESSIQFGCLRAVPSFLAGMAIYPLATSRFADLKVPPWVAHIAPCTAAVLMALNVVPELVIFVHVIAIFLLARADLGAAPGIFSRPFPRLLANASYGVYMWHAMIGQVSLKHLPQALHIDPVWQPALIVVALILTPVVAILFYLWFEEPARRYLSGQRRRQAATIVARDRPSFVSSRLKGSVVDLRRRWSGRSVTTPGGRIDASRRRTDPARTIGR